VILIITDEQEINRAIKSLSMALCLSDFDNFLRNEIKYSDKEEYQPVRDKLFEIMNEHSIKINEILE
jgi:hypothetical protein